MRITCCYGCVPPKRHGGCNSICPEYKKQREMLDAENKEARKKKAIQKGLDDNVIKGCIKVEKRRRKNRYENA